MFWGSYIIRRIPQKQPEQVRKKEKDGSDGEEEVGGYG